MTEKKQEAKTEKKELPPQVTVEQVAQRLLILQSTIKKMQTEYNNLHSKWSDAMHKAQEQQPKE